MTPHGESVGPIPRSVSPISRSTYPDRRNHVSLHNLFQPKLFSLFSTTNLFLSTSPRKESLIAAHVSQEELALSIISLWDESPRSSSASEPSRFCTMSCTNSIPFDITRLGEDVSPPCWENEPRCWGSSWLGWDALISASLSIVITTPIERLERILESCPVRGMV